jgi:hypothetical protein
VAALLGATLAACGDGDSKATSAPASKDTAATVWDAIHGAVPTSSFNQTVTAANDSNHMLGRPHQYTSAIKFKDSRVKGDDVVAADEYDVSWGGGIEVFESKGDAQARAKYIQAVTKDLPMFGEYDYVHGPVVVRVSHYLTPAQAAEYDKAATDIG